MKKTINLGNCTVKELKEALKNTNDDVIINICNTGTTGIIKDVNMDISKKSICINIEADALKKR